MEAASLHPNVYRIINFAHLLLLLNHLVAGGYFILSCHMDTNNASPITVNDTVQQYLEAVYWSTVTLTTIGDVPWPESNVEYLVQILGFILGLFVFATIIGQVGTVLNQRNAKRMEFELQVDSAKKYMREHEVPKEVQKSILGWYQYTWARGLSVRKEDSFQMLPTKLRTELAIHMNLKTLKKVSLFRECEPGFLHDLVLRMQLVVTTPGELVCRKGEIAREMFIISDGMLEVLGDDDTVIRTLQAGDFFGEIGLLMMGSGSNRRTADVCSLGYSDLFVVTKEDTMNLLNDYPEAKKALQDRANLYIGQFDVMRDATSLRHNSETKDWKESTVKYNDRMRRSLNVRNSCNINALSERVMDSFVTNPLRGATARSSRSADDTVEQDVKLTDNIAKDLMTSIEILSNVSREHQRIYTRSKLLEEELEQKTKELEKLKRKYERSTDSTPSGGETLTSNIYH